MPVTWCPDKSSADHEVMTSSENFLPTRRCDSSLFNTAVCEHRSFIEAWALSVSMGGCFHNGPLDPFGQFAFVNEAIKKKEEKRWKRELSQAQKMIGIARSAIVSHELPERKEGGKQHVFAQQSACHTFAPTKHHSVSFKIAPHQWIKQQRVLTRFTTLPFFFSMLIPILVSSCFSQNIDPHKKTVPILRKKHVALTGL